MQILRVITLKRRKMSQVRRISGRRDEGWRRRRVMTSSVKQSLSERVQVELKETKGVMVEMWRRYELTREAGSSWGEERVMERAWRKRREWEWRYQRGLRGGRGGRDERRRTRGWQKRHVTREERGEVSDEREWWRRERGRVQTGEEELKDNKQTLVKYLSQLQVQF